jgi:hypothetical protein
MVVLEFAFRIGKDSSVSLASTKTKPIGKRLVELARDATD